MLQGVYNKMTQLLLTSEMTEVRENLRYLVGSKKMQEFFPVSETGQAEAGPASPQFQQLSVSGNSSNRGGKRWSEHLPSSARGRMISLQKFYLAHEKHQGKHISISDASSNMSRPESGYVHDQLLSALGEVSEDTDIEIKIQPQGTIHKVNSNRKSSSRYTSNKK